MKKFILASKSPRRKELLESVNLEFDIIESDVDESVVPKDLAPDLYVKELALLKATSVAKNIGAGKYVIGADTIVVLGDEIIGKPKDADDARKILKKLSDKTHFVYTGLCIADTSTATAVSFFDKTEVTFRDIRDDEIDKYIQSGEPFGKAGAYAIQGLASIFAKKINGSFANVVGLPVCKLCEIFKKEFDVDIL